MTIEDRLRETLSRQVANVRPSQDAWSSIQRRVSRNARRRLARRVGVAIFALALSATALAWVWVSFLSGVDTLQQPGSDPAFPSIARPVVAATIRVGAFPRAVVVSEGAAWVSVQDQHGSSVVRIDPVTNEVVASVQTQTAPDHLAVGAGDVWGTIEGVDGAVLRIDPQTERIVATIPVGGGDFAQDVAADEQAVWVTVVQGEDGSSSLVRIDPELNEIVATIPLPRFALDVAVGEGAVWVLDSKVVDGSIVGQGHVIRVDPATNELAASTPTGAAGTRLAVGAGSVWVEGWLSSYMELETEEEDSLVAVRIDTQTTQVIGQVIPLKGGFVPISVDSEAVWFVGSDTLTNKFNLSRLNTQTMQVDASVALETEPADLVLDVGVGAAWVANFQDSVTRIDLH